MNAVPILSAVSIFKTNRASHFLSFLFLFCQTYNDCQSPRARWCTVWLCFLEKSGCYTHDTSTIWLPTQDTDSEISVDILGFLLLWRDAMYMTTLIRKTFNWGGDLYSFRGSVYCGREPGSVQADVLEKVLRILMSLLICNRKWFVLLGVTLASMRPQSLPPQCDTSPSRPYLF